MNKVERIIQDEIFNQNTVFVFPSQMATNRWMERATEICNVKAVAKERFLPWDSFKENSVRSKQQNKHAIPSTLRKMYASRLVSENADEKFLSYFIQQDFAKNSSNFENWIASLLPQLALWKKYCPTSDEFDEQDRDLEQIYTRYEKFLQENSLFDPAWEVPPFEADGNRYYIFFPEILSDYDEYKSILESSDDIMLVSVADFASSFENCASENGSLAQGNSAQGNSALVQFFKNSRLELKNAVLYLRKMHDENKIAWQDMALSVPDMENYGAYIQRELDLYQIPYISRYAKPLSSSGAGGFFSQAQACVESNFDFASVRNLLLNSELPWNDIKVIQQLIDFGKKYHCVCSFYDGEEKIDIWEKSFSQNTSQEIRAMNFYKKFKNFITKMVKATSFDDIRMHYFQFRENFFDLSVCTEKSDQILSRCISELSELIDLEIDFPSCKVKNPFSFFCQILKDKKYLAQTSQCGISVLEYQVAASAPFKVQVILDASQNGISVIYKKLPFLLDSKRKKVFGSNAETNVSPLFITLYALNATSKNVLFSAAERTFTGYSQPTSYLPEINRTKDNAITDILEADFYRTERKWLSNPGSTLNERTQTEKNSLDSWLASGTYTKTQVPETDGAKTITITKKSPYISQSSLKAFFECPRKYLLKRKLSIEEETSEAELTDEYEVGNVNHKILELYGSELKNRKMTVQYDEEILEKCIDEALSFKDNYKNQNSFMTKKLFETARASIKMQISAALQDFVTIFGGYTILETEAEYTRSVEGAESDSEILLGGKIDCILQDPNTSQTFVVDYKSGKTPDNLYYDEEKNTLCDFQMPMYYYICDDKFKIDNAAFFSLAWNSSTQEKGAKERFVPVFGEEARNIKERNGSRKDTLEKIKTTKDFQLEVGKMLECAKIFDERIEKQDFSIGDDNSQTEKFTIEPKFTTCAGCDYKSICRRTFIVSKH